MMTELSEKRRLTVDEVGLVDDNHVDKKLKLSKVGEPLNKKDLKLFQKDVLYRNLKEYKLKYIALEQTITLNQDVGKIKEYYEAVIHELERENSEAVHRVMGKAETPTPKFESEKEVSAVPEPPSVKEETADVVVKTKENDEEADEDINSLKKDINEMAASVELSSLTSQIDELNHKIEFLEKKLGSNAEELSKTNIAYNEQQTVLGNSKLESQKLQAELSTCLAQFNTLSEEHKLLLKKLNEYQINSEYLQTPTSDKFYETLKVINDSLLTDLQNLQKNLARIRSERDKLRSENNLLTTQTKNTDVVEDLLKEITTIKETIVNFEKTHASVTTDNDLLEELKSIELAYNMLAGTKLDAIHKKIINKQQMEKVLFDFEKLKEKYASLSRLLQDSKVEIEILKKVKNKADELISDYEIRERVAKGKVAGLEKQLEFSREVEKFAELNHNETLSKLEILKKEVDTLRNAVTSKDSLISKAAADIDTLKKSKADLEAKVSESQDLQSRQEKKHKNLITKLKQASEKISNPHLATYVFGNTQLSDTGSNINDSQLPGDSSLLQDQLTNFKQLVYCPLCTLNFKNQMIKNCGHTFCENCIKERLSARMRKCPSCNLPFGSTDVLDIVL